MPPLTLLIKPASDKCNLCCRYCFYMDEAQKRTYTSSGRMSDYTMHTLVDKAMEYAEGECVFAFQGGEPTLMGLDFYKKAIDYIQTNPNFKRLRISYSLQTNGVLLDDAWAKWLAQNRVLVGISLDGPQKIHDRYRVDRNGDGTFQRVMRAIRLLEKYRITYNILSVITGTSARHSQQIYEFFKKCGFRYQQYIECLDPIGELPGQHTYSLTPEKYETFLKGLFDIWYLDMKAGRYVYNRYFENLLMIMNRQPPETCNLCGSCYPQWVIEADGSVYPCDFYALDQWKLGNISINSFEEMKKARKRQEFTIWSESIPKECQMCSWFALCRNGCRRNREPVTATSAQKNYYCLAYMNFLEYSYPRLLEIYWTRQLNPGRF